MSTPVTTIVEPEVAKRGYVGPFVVTEEVVTVLKVVSGDKSRLDVPSGCALLGGGYACGLIAGGVLRAQGQTKSVKTTVLTFARKDGRAFKFQQRRITDALQSFCGHDGRTYSEKVATQTTDRSRRGKFYLNGRCN